MKIENKENRVTNLDEFLETNGITLESDPFLEETPLEVCNYEFE